MARAAERQLEFTIRLALGCSQAALLRQLVVESFLLCGAGALLGLGAAATVLRVLSRMSIQNLPHLERLALDPAALGMALGLTALATVLFALIGAVQGRTRDLAGPLKYGVRVGGSPRARRVQRLLVAAEFGLAVAVVIATVFLGQSFLRLRRAPVGYDGSNLLYLGVTLPKLRYPTAREEQRFFERLAGEVRQLPEVVAVAGVERPPLVGSSSGSYGCEGQGPRDILQQVADIRQVTPEYFTAMGLALRRGRAFTAEDRASTTRVVVVSESLARRHWPERDPVGQRLYLGGSPATWLQVVGVVADAKYGSPERPFAPAIYQPLAQSDFQHADSSIYFLVVRTRTAPESSLGVIRQKLAGLDAQVAFNYVETAEAAMGRTMGSRVLQTRLIAFYGAASALLACVGIYGIVTQTVGRRFREYGIRMACGATAADLLRHLALDLSFPLGAGALFGIVLVQLVSTLLEKVLYGFTAGDRLVYLLVPLGLALVSALCCLGPMRRVTRLQVTEALRCE